jgi:hypothetical protein
MATKRPKLDLNQLAKSIVGQATGEVELPKETAAQQAGRRGGLIGGAARASRLTPEQRSEIAKKAAAKRWA